TGRAVTEPLLPRGRARATTAGVALGGGIAGDIVATVTVHAGAVGFLTGAAVGAAGSIAGRQVRDLRQKSSALSAFADAVAGALTPWRGTEVWHAVPTILATNAKRANAFADAWHRHVSRGRLLYTGSPEGFGILQAVRDDDPFAVTTALRTVWR